MKCNFRKGLIIKNIIAILLIIVLLVPYCFSGIKTTFGDNQSDLQSAKDKQNEINAKVDKVKKELEDLKKKSNDLSAYIAQLDAQMANLDHELDVLNTQVEELVAQIVETEEKLKKAEADQRNQYEAMKLRIQFMYEHNDSSYIEMLMTATSMAEMLNKLEYINRISQYDRNMLTEYENTVKFIADAKAKLTKDYEVLSVKQLDLQTQREALSLVEEEKQKELQALASNKAAQEGYLAQLESDKKSVDNQVASIEAQIRAQENANGNASIKTSYDGGKFKWPTNSTRITSPFGDTDGRSAGHKGVDIGASRAGVAGDPIYAAYEGKVVISCYSSSAGNYIMVYHGDGLYTRYLHCSKLLVSVGDTVTQGQKIALMGTTGDSTGVHLHFDVRLNGVYVNPMSYFG